MTQTRHRKSLFHTILFAIARNIEIKMQYDWEQHCQSYEQPRYPAWPVGYLTWPLRNEGQLGVTVSHSSVRPPVPLIRVAPYLSVFLWILGRVIHPLLPRRITCVCVIERHTHTYTCVALSAFYRGEKSNDDDEKIPAACINEERRGPEVSGALNVKTAARLRRKRILIFQTLPW